jgi:hypothetical protein
MGDFELKISDTRMNEFGEALERLMKVEVVRKKESRRRLNV